MSKEKENKKTALELACQWISDLISKSPNCILGISYPEDEEAITCPLAYEECRKISNTRVCTEKLKQYFQRKADIPDGWDVVKELCENLLADIAIFERIEFREYRGEKQPDWKFLIVNFCNNMIKKLQQAGIEVDDE